MKSSTIIVMKQLITLLTVLLFSSVASANYSEKIATPSNLFRNYQNLTNSYNKQLAVDLLTAGIGNGNIDIADALVSEEYIQHNPNIADGKEALIALIQFLAGDDRLTHFTANFKRIVAEGDLVALHYHAPDFGIGPETPEGSAIVDIFRIEHGRVAEHWDVIQPVVTETASGNTMFDGAGNPYAPVKRRDLRAHKKVVRRFYKALNAGEFETFRQLIDEEKYIQHNPFVPNGVDAVIDLFSAIGPVEADVKRVIAQGDLVFVHVHYATFNQAGVDIFRFEDGMIVEHWDILQPIPDESANDNGMF